MCFSIVPEAFALNYHQSERMKSLTISLIRDLKELSAQDVLRVFDDRAQCVTRTADSAYGLNPLS